MAEITRTRWQLLQHHARGCAISLVSQVQNYSSCSLHFFQWRDTRYC